MAVMAWPYLFLCTINTMCDQKLNLVISSRFKLLVMKCSGERRAHPLCLWKSLQICLKKTLKILQQCVYVHDLKYFLYILIWCSHGSFFIVIGCPCSPLGWIGIFSSHHKVLLFFLFMMFSWFLLYLTLLMQSDDLKLQRNICSLYLDLNFALFNA